MNKLLTVFCLLLIAIYPLRAGVEVTGAIQSDNHVNGMFNSTSTTMTITVRLTDSDATEDRNDDGTRDNARVNLEYTFDTSAPSSGDITTNGDGNFPDALTVDSNLGSNPTFLVDEILLGRIGAAFPCEI